MTAPRYPHPSQDSFHLKDLEGPVETFFLGVRLRNVKPISSYSWIEAPTPRIAVPGYLRIWRETTVTTVLADSGVHDVDRAWEIDPFPYPYMLLLTHCMMTSNLLGKTYLFIHRHAILETIGELRGFGDQYELAAAKSRRGAEGEISHRIISYEFGGLKILLHYEVDACIEPEGEDDSFLTSLAYIITFLRHDHFVGIIDSLPHDEIWDLGAAAEEATRRMWRRRQVVRGGTSMSLERVAGLSNKDGTSTAQRAEESIQLLHILMRPNMPRTTHPPGQENSWEATSGHVRPDFTKVRELTSFCTLSIDQAAEAIMASHFYGMPCTNTLLQLSGIPIGVKSPEVLSGTIEWISTKLSHATARTRTTPCRILIFTVFTFGTEGIINESTNLTTVDFLSQDALKCCTATVAWRSRRHTGLIHGETRPTAMQDLRPFQDVHEASQAGEIQARTLSINHSPSQAFQLEEAHLAHFSLGSRANVP
ncbi:hypothetical protein EDC04DRAFT_3089662 [Pisolithus marmoratus]|nr:hypothetical protein EDC04DRAFT_3089662 [Pisolithus marmoratus]